MRWMMALSRKRLMWLLVLLVGGLAGCGYTTEETYPTGYSTVAMPIFENRTFYKGIEYDLAEAMTKEMESRTPYKASGPGSADTILEGRITDVTQRRVSRTKDASLPEVVEVRVTVDFQWKDLRTGELILDRQGFMSVGQFIPTTPIGEPFAVAQHDAAARLASDIVDTLRGGW